jgi:hypothetical protein
MTGLLAFAVGVAFGFVLTIGISLAMQPRGRPFGEPYDVFEGGVMNMQLIRRFIHEIRQRLLFRRCGGCSDPSPHSHHLTWIGKRRYVSSP